MARVGLSTLARKYWLMAPHERLRISSRNNEAIYIMAGGADKGYKPWSELGGGILASKTARVFAEILDE